MENKNKYINKINIENELKNSYLDYAMSVIISRALPDVRDGLKPVHRRILYSMNLLDNTYNKSYKKSARIVGDVIGKYHPHGDTAVYESIIRMAQDFSLRYTLIDGQGNFGSIDGDSAAAMRYTEIRMSKISNEMLVDIDKNTVNFVKNYDGTEIIPNILPSRIPNLLINGSYGIAVGIATNIPPHNLSEVINGCLALIENEEINTEELMEYIYGPDFPTYGEIHGINDILQMYKTGKGKICIKSKIKIEKNNKKKIIVEELPYQVNKLKLIEKIIELIKNKKITGIENIKDESNKDGIRIVIELKKDIPHEVILNNLYKFTPLQIQLSVNMIALVNGKPKTLSLKEILNLFIEHRKDIVYKRTLFLLNKDNEKIHIIEGLIIAINNIDEIIYIIKKSISLEETKLNLLNKKWKLNNNIINNKHYLSNIKINNNNGINLTNIQIKYILDLKLQRLNNLEYKNIIKEYNDILYNIEKNNLIIKNNKNLIKVIKDELIDIKNKYKDNRKTKIIHKKTDIDINNLINKKNVIITLSYNGYIKFQDISEYESQKKGGKGKSSTKIKDKDFIYILLVANTHDDILLFSNKGIIYKIKVYQLPELNKYSKGKLIYNVIPMNKEDKITAILPININNNENKNICMLTSNGFIKKTSIHEFRNLRSIGLIAIKLNKNDKLVGVNVTDGNNDIMIFSKNGRAVRFSENKLRITKRLSYGVKGINLLNNDKVISLVIPKLGCQILTITENGIGKRTNQIDYPVKSRFSKGVISIKLTEKSGKVIKSKEVYEKDDVLIITNNGILVRIKVSEVNLISRNTKGNLLIKVCNNDNVVDLQKV